LTRFRIALDQYNRSTVLSGDYTAATDYLHLDVVRTFGEELRNLLFAKGAFRLALLVDDELIATQYLHLGTQSAAQVRGSCMGGQLSFICLCLANGFVAQKICGKRPWLVNGDDHLLLLR
jgi:hypothetical protein